MMLFAAGVVLVLHVLLPHSHVSELTSEQHSAVHAESEDVLDWIELLLQEHEQIGDNFVIGRTASEFAVPAFVVLVPLLAVIPALIRLDDTVATVAPLDFDDLRLAQLGHVSSWGVRPPPVV